MFRLLKVEFLCGNIFVGLLLNNCIIHWKQWILSLTDNFLFLSNMLYGASLIKGLLLIKNVGKSLIFFCRIERV